MRPRTEDRMDQRRLDELANAPLTRRRLLQGGALAGITAFLAACAGGNRAASPSAGATGTGRPSASAAATGTAGATGTPAATASAAASPTDEASPTAAEASPSPNASVGGTLAFANWPAYIDLAGAAGDEGAYQPGSSPTIEDFQKKFGVEVRYEEKIGDNITFFRSIEPQLVAGQPTGWDLIVHTDWLAAQLVERGWAEQIDKANVPNAEKNLREALRNQPWDPNQDYHYTWQSGMTGIGYNVASLKGANLKEPTRVADLWELPPDKVSFLTEARDTIGLTLLKLGIDPANATIEDMERARDDIQPLVDRGLRFLDNAYIQEFAAKSVWAAMVWSGDLASSGAEDDRFVVPEEGAMIWSDNMLIPKGAQNKRAAEAMINYVYEPAVAAQIAAYVYYISPVEGVKEAIAELDEEAAENELLFPTEETVAKQKAFKPLSADEDQQLNDLFAQLTGL